MAILYVQMSNAICKKIFYSSEWTSKFAILLKYIDGGGHNKLADMTSIGLPTIFSPVWTLACPVSTKIVVIFATSKNNTKTKNNYMVFLEILKTLNGLCGHNFCTTENIFYMSLFLD